MAFVGGYAPRQCGIATFTTDLVEALADRPSATDYLAVAMNDPDGRYPYPGRVRFEIPQARLESYQHAADYLNVNDVDVVCLQHEYGIFGGGSGRHVITLLRGLRMPVVTTLHTILAEPNPQQRAVMDDIVRLSERLVVMSARGAELLQEVHQVPAAKISEVPHGVPPHYRDPASKARVGVAGRRMILTFGLLSPDKGIEYVIAAMPTILERIPEVVYVVLGATHPHVRRDQGEAYRLQLERQARTLGVDANVIFRDRFVGRAELAEYMSAADIYVTPYAKAEQITSGTLAYAVGAGKAVVSTPYWYASELLADGRGVLVGWRDPASIADAVVGLLQDDAKRAAMSARATEYGLQMAWPRVAEAYEREFRRAAASYAERDREEFRATTLACAPAKLPEVRLDHLCGMTDDTGVLQHAVFDIPRYEDGYCVDDNARALIAMQLAEDAELEDAALVRSLGRRYLAFVRHAWDDESGRFRNFMRYDRRWSEEPGSEDSHGRAIWAVGTVAGRARDSGRRALCRGLFHASLPAVAEFTSPRALAFALLGIDAYLAAFEGDRSVQRVQETLAESLLASLARQDDGEWPWFEDYLTYENARMPQALLVSAARLKREDMLAAALRSLDWLVGMETSEDGYFAPVGSSGFHMREGSRAQFDQQPVEAAGMVAACLAAHASTQEARWESDARRAFDWYMGQNELQLALCDARTGACRDGLHHDRVNENQGAEASLSFLLALLELRIAGRDIAASRGRGPQALAGTRPAQARPVAAPRDASSVGSEVGL